MVEHLVTILLQISGFTILTINIFHQIVFAYYMWYIWCISGSKHSGHSAAAAEATNSASNDAYQELNTMPPPVYDQLAR